MYAATVVNQDRVGIDREVRACSATSLPNTTSKAMNGIARARIDAVVYGGFFPACEDFWENVRPLKPQLRFFLSELRRLWLNVP